jgi:hypothetical protein
MKGREGFRFELSEYGGCGRLSVGPFPEYADSLTTEHTRLLATWWGAVAGLSSESVAIWCASRRTPFGPPRSAPASSDAPILLSWTQKGLLRTTEHQLRSVSAAYFNVGSVEKLWSADGFAILVGATTGLSDVSALEQLLKDVLPPASLLRDAGAVIIPWYHRLWLDLYCDLAGVQAHIERLLEAAAQAGVQVTQGKDEFV